MPRGMRYENSCEAVSNKSLTPFAQSEVTIDIPAQFSKGYIHDDLSLIKQGMHVSGILAWGLVLWGLIKFHIGFKEPQNTVMNNILVIGLLTTSYWFY